MARQCAHCNRWFQSKQAVRGHLKRCPPWLAVRSERQPGRHPGDGLGSWPTSADAAAARQAAFAEKVAMAVADEVERRLAPVASPLDAMYELEARKARDAEDRRVALEFERGVKPGNKRVAAKPEPPERSATEHVVAVLKVAKALSRKRRR